MAFLVLGLAGGLEADTVILRSGLRYADVRAQPVGESHRILFYDGSVKIVLNSEIRSVKRGPTSWATIQPPPQEIVPPRIEPAPPVVPRPQSPWTFTPAMKSMLLPGWGQYAQGRPLAGAIYASLALATFSRYWIYRQRHSAAEADYNDPLPVGLVAAQSTTGALTIGQAALFNTAYLAQKETKVYQIQRQGNNTLMLLSFIWLWNMLDIGRGGVPWEKQWTGVQQQNRAPEFTVSLGRGSVGFAARFSL